MNHFLLALNVLFIDLILKGKPLIKKGKEVMMNILQIA